MNTEKKAWNEILNPKFLGSWDVPNGGKLTVKITGADEEEIDNFKTNKKEKKLIVYLENLKPMVCNITNAKNISKALKTKMLNEWVGRSIQLEVKQIRAFGENTDCIRVCDVVPKMAEKEELNPKHVKWEGAKKALKDGSVKIEDIKKIFKLTEENETAIQN